MRQSAITFHSGVIGLLGLSRAAAVGVLVVLLGGLMKPAQAITWIEPERDSYSLGDQVRILEDAARRYDIDTVSSDALAHLFEPSGNAVPNLGLDKSRFWVEIRLAADPYVAAEQREWLLELALPTVGAVALFHPDGDSWRVFEAGRSTPFADRPVPSRHFVFPVTLEPGNPTTLYLRVESNAPLYLPLRLMTPEVYSHGNDLRQLGWGLYFGALLLMLLYNACLYVALRRTAHLYYVLSIGGLLLAQATLHGFSHIYLWRPDSWWDQISLPLLVSVTVFFAGQFVRSFLNTSRVAPTCDHILLAFLILAVASGFGAVLLPAAASTQLAMVLALLAAPTALACGLITARRQADRGVRWFVAAWAALLFGATCFWLAQFGLLPVNAFTLKALQLGALIEAGLLSLALGARMHATYQARLHAEQRRAASESAAHAKYSFLTNMAREMRAPISAIQSYAEMTLAGNRDARQSEMLNSIQSASRRLVTIVHQILDLSRLNAGHVDFETVEFDLDQLLEEVGNTFTAELRAQGSEILLLRRASVPRYIRTDRFHLKQVLVNLVANALRHAPEGDVEVIVERSAAAATSVTLLVSVDTGDNNSVGAFATDTLDPFRIPAGEGAGGVNLSLAICKQLIERLNGAFWVRGGRHGGTRALFTLEVEWVDKPARPVQPLPRIAVASGKRLLRSLVAEVLAERDQVPEIYGNLREAGQRFDGDIIVIDDDETLPRTVPAHLTGRRVQLIAAASEAWDGAWQNLPPAIRCTPFSKPYDRLGFLRALQHAIDEPDADSLGARPTPPALDQIGFRRALIADASPTNRKFLQLVLGNAGIECDLAEDGLSALAMLGAHEYDALLLDVELNDDTGQPIAERVLGTDDCEQPRLVALEPDATPERRTFWRRRGYHTVIAKPIDQLEVYRALERIARAVDEADDRQGAG